MANIYLRVDSATERVVLTHYNPFDPNTGLMENNETQEEARTRLLLTGVFVESVPEPSTVANNYRPVLHYNSTNGCYYTYAQIPSGDEILIKSLENIVGSIKSVIPTSLLLTSDYLLSGQTKWYDISSLYSSGINYGIGVNKNGAYLRTSEFTVDHTVIPGSVILILNTALTSTDYCIVTAVDNLSDHTQAISTIINLEATLNNKADVSHTHVIADVAGLSNTLQSLSSVYAPITHTHQVAQIVNSDATATAKGFVKISDNYQTLQTTTGQPIAASSYALTNGLSTKASSTHTHDYLPLTGGTLTGALKFRTTGSNDTSSGGTFYVGSTDPSAVMRLNYNGYFYATKIYNSVYNDLAECFIPIDDIKYEEVKYRIAEINEDGKVRLATKESNMVVGIVSTSYGYLLGGSEEEVKSSKKIPIGLSGTLWVDAEDSVNVSYMGRFVCSGDNGKAVIIPKGKSSTAKYEGAVVGKVVNIDEENNRFKVLLNLK